MQVVEERGRKIERVAPPASACSGLGYVGLPLSVEFAAAGLPVTGLDLDHGRRSDAVNAGRS